MIHFSRQTKRYIAGFFLAGLFGVLLQYMQLQRFPLALGSSVLYGGIVITWAATIERRIMQREMRRNLLGLSLCLLVLFVLRMGKYELFNTMHTAQRYLWYAYYIPLIGASVLSFMAALCIGKSPDWKPTGWWGILFFVSLFLVFTVMTNDLHQMVFRFAGPEEFWTNDYTYGPVFLLVYAWIFSLVGMTIWIVFRRCSLPARRKLLWVPLLPLLLELVISVLIQMNAGHAPLFHGRTVVQFQEMFSFMMIAFWESCIQIGLIPCNSDYDTIFDLSGIRAVIADEDRNPVLLSADPLNLSKEQMRLADRGTVMIDPDHRVQGHPIRGGAVYWVEDISAIRAIHEALRETGEQLSEESSLIRAESMLSEQNAQYAVENRLYDRMNEEVSPQMEKIRILLEDEKVPEETFRRNLRECMVLCAYVKRRSNLTLIADRQQKISSEELWLSVRESLEYLKLLGTVAAVQKDGTGLWPAREIIASYDFFEFVLEAVLRTVHAMSVRIETGERRSLVLEMGFSEDMRLPARMQSTAVSQAGGKTLWYVEDDTVYAEAVFGEKGGTS